MSLYYRKIMRQFLGLFLCALLWTSCDNGNIVFNAFNFDAAAVRTCNNTNLIFKVNGREALIINIPSSSFVNSIGTVSIPINSSNEVIYRLYDGTISENAICATISPATPIVREEWHAVGGTLDIITTSVTETDDAGNEKIVGYSHAIIFRNSTFMNNEREMVFESYLFGSYRTDANDTPFDFEGVPLQHCSNSDLIFKSNLNEALLVSLPNALFTNETTSKTVLISNTNRIVYRLYNSNITSNFLCSVIPPTTPTILEEWNAQTGVAGVSGLIEITSTPLVDGTGYQHEIVLSSIIFVNGTNTRTYTTNLGTITTLF